MTYRDTFILVSWRIWSLRLSAVGPSDLTIRVLFIGSAQTTINPQYQTFPDGCVHIISDRQSVSMCEQLAIVSDRQTDRQTDNAVHNQAQIYFFPDCAPRALLPNRQTDRQLCIQKTSNLQMYVCTLYQTDSRRWCVNNLPLCQTDKQLCIQNVKFTYEWGSL